MLRTEWNTRMTREARQRDDDKRAEIKKRKVASNDKSFNSGIMFWVAKKAAITYPCVRLNKSDGILIE